MARQIDNCRAILSHVAFLRSEKDAFQCLTLNKQKIEHAM